MPHLPFFSLKVTFQVSSAPDPRQFRDSNKGWQEIAGGGQGTRPPRQRPCGPAVNPAAPLFLWILTTQLQMGSDPGRSGAGSTKPPWGCRGTGEAESGAPRDSMGRREVGEASPRLLTDRWAEPEPHMCGFDPMQTAETLDNEAWDRRRPRSPTDHQEVHA